tara:strand:- start:240 stop:509 length:270 start_codon:yes stop_codon:yes gene_type:complete
MDVDEKKRRNAMIFDRMATEASRSIVYRDTIIEVDSLITDLLELEGTYYSKQTLELIRQRIRETLAGAGLMIENSVEYFDDEGNANGIA